MYASVISLAIPSPFVAFLFFFLPSELHAEKKQCRTIGWYRVQVTGLVISNHSTMSKDKQVSPDSASAFRLLSQPLTICACPRVMGRSILTAESLQNASANLHSQGHEETKIILVQLTRQWQIVIFFPFSSKQDVCGWLILHSGCGMGWIKFGLPQSIAMLHLLNYCEGDGRKGHFF